MRNLIQFLVRNSNFLIFLILEVVAFILICTSHEYQRSAAWSGANRLTAGINNIKTSIEEYFHLRTINTDLAEENTKLKAELMLLANEKETMIERDSQYIYTHLDWDYIPAKVIKVSENKQHNYLTINKGSRDGIELDMGVIGADGVVGIVSAVGEKYALVVPIIHTNISFSSRLKTNGQIGGTSWDGNDTRFVNLTEMARHIAIHRGDTVVTSGLTVSFPEGIMLGTIWESTLGQGDSYHQARLKISTNYQSIRYVQVLCNKNKHLYYEME